MAFVLGDIHKEKIIVHILKVGVNYQVAPIEIREKLTFSEIDVEEAMLSLSEQDHILENIILSTCNRTEVFTVVESIEAGKDVVMQFLSNWFDMPEVDLNEHLQFKYDEEAIEHAFKLTVGLDSMVLGETQILGQVREVFLTAQALKTTGKIFNELFKRIVTFAKSAHNNTVIGEHAVSISYVAVELSKKIFGQMAGKHAVILGAGEMGELSLKNLHGSGVSDITVVNRSLENAQKLAARFNARAATMDELEDVLADADILISSTGANAAVLTKEQLVPLQKRRKNKPLFLIDIAVPRDIDSSVDELDNIFLYDVDDLQYVADENMAARKEAATMIESQLVHELSSFQNWVNTLEVVPLIKALREKSIGIQERTLESIFRKMPDLDEREEKVLRKHTSSIINQLLEQPIKQAKKIGNNEYSPDAKEMFKDIFGLESYMDDVDQVEKSDQAINKNSSFVLPVKR